MAEDAYGCELDHIRASLSETSPPVGASSQRNKSSIPAPILSSVQATTNPSGTSPTASPSTDTVPATPPSPTLPSIHLTIDKSPDEMSFSDVRNLATQFQQQLSLADADWAGLLSIPINQSIYEHYIEETRGGDRDEKLRWTVSPTRAIIQTPSKIHEFFGPAWSDMARSVPEDASKFLSIGGASTTKLYNSLQVPDFEILPESKPLRLPTNGALKPLFVIEIGYTESLPHVRRSAIHFLLETHGVTGVAHVIKIYPKYLALGDVTTAASSSSKPPRLLRAEPHDMTPSVLAELEDKDEEYSDDEEEEEAKHDDSGKEEEERAVNLEDPNSVTANISLGASRAYIEEWRTYRYENPLGRLPRGRHLNQMFRQDKRRESVKVLPSYFSYQDDGEEVYLLGAYRSRAVQFYPITRDVDDRGSDRARKAALERGETEVPAIPDPTFYPATSDSVLVRFPLATLSGMLSRRIQASEVSKREPDHGSEQTTRKKIRITSNSMANPDLHEHGLAMFNDLPLGDEPVTDEAPRRRNKT
ncbi:hypothetical protein CC1G_08692 [Coprinopsis cinerea okayama7|uniref:Uncharacterized protein n=1 Tax=Coprinopsis cinerea (strain Okayama-7 / 130 / ATCC MYA-4618 / FGSC 9003) TaxID=240176 RepID=A8NZH2_COPC7|nr:hypothetical protein CC1G_08692 [Coprinopsis cinerea okayama7\|eukprot:XP_001837679.2 hypothetical protein CC1G_08692 [Coprinopsis cinerea okayama7\